MFAPTSILSILLPLLLITGASLSAQQETGAGRTIDQSAIDRLASACRDSHSTSFAVSVDGRMVLSSSRERPQDRVATHSVLKSISSLAVGRLMKQGKLSDLDEPVWHYFPEWKQGYKKEITIRHLLNHTSGMESLESMMSDWEGADDLLQVALCTDLINYPGQGFLYNNKAAILLLGVIGKISGMPPGDYIATEIFQPLGITDYNWIYDNAGNLSVLETTSDELIKIGQLVLDRGEVNGKELIEDDYIDQALSPSQEYVGNCGLLWWLIPQTTTYVVDDEFIGELREAEIDDDVIAKFERLKGRYENVNIPDERLAEVFGKDWANWFEEEFYPHFPSRSRREYSEKMIGSKAEGWLGQYIVVYPEKGIVATRMIANSEGYNPATDSMQEFEKVVYEVVR